MLFSTLIFSLYWGFNAPRRVPAAFLCEHHFTKVNCFWQDMLHLLQDSFACQAAYCSACQLGNCGGISDGFSLHASLSDAKLLQGDCVLNGVGCFFTFSSRVCVNFTFSSRVCVKEIHVEEQLGIVSDESLETMLWSEVVSRLVQCQKAGTSRVHLVSKA